MGIASRLGPAPPANNAIHLLSLTIVFAHFEQMSHRDPKCFCDSFQAIKAWRLDSALDKAYEIHANTKPFGQLLLRPISRNSQIAQIMSEL